ncbi:DNA translocase FtsK [Pantoea vagans]|uniref:DNA translocase FtsK n=1 Tax=Pantoea vagans TaxID=470934 RepID=UPI003209AB01
MKSIEQWFELNPQWKPSAKFFEKEAEELDELLTSALAYIVTERRFSVSIIQRHFRIGYNRAARIVEQLEREGFVSPPDENGNRKVY